VNVQTDLQMFPTAKATAGQQIEKNDEIVEVLLYVVEAQGFDENQMKRKFCQ